MKKAPKRVLFSCLIGSYAVEAVDKFGLAAVQRQEDILHHAHTDSLQRLVGVGTQMGGAEHVGQTHQRILLCGRFADEDVTGCSTQLTGGEGGIEGGFVHHAAAAGVDENRRGLAVGKAFGIEKVGGTFRQMDADIDDVGVFQHLIQRLILPDAKLGGLFRGPVGVVTNDLAAKAVDHDFGHAPGDVANAHKTDGLSAQLVAEKLRRGVCAEVAGGDKTVSQIDLPEQGQRERYNELV